MGRPAKDRRGERYGRLIAQEQAGRAADGAVLWHCLCDCGKRIITRGDSLGAGSTQSCGCLAAELRHVPEGVDRVGQRYGRLIVLAATDQRGAGGCVKWLCVCDCGNQKVVSGNNLNGGNTRSCGCLHRDNIHRTHGMSHTVENKTWRAMKSRCNDPNNPRYRDYGGRGIKVCDRWNAFENFFADMGPRPAKGYSIERRDNEAGYSPENCYWATAAEQKINKRKQRRSSEVALIEAERDALLAENERLRAQLRS